MSGNKLQNEINASLSAEQVAYDDVSGHSVSILLRDRQQRLLDKLKEIGDTGDLATILLAEKLILENEKRVYADTKLMKTSLGNALHELKVTLSLVEKVQDPEVYKTVDESFQLPKHRLGGLPRDEARQFFMSHHSRLSNLEKARLSKMDKKLISARKFNLSRAKERYISLQRNALAVPEPALGIKNN